MKQICFAISLILANTTVCQNILVQFEVRNLDKVNTAELLINDTISLFKVSLINSDNKSNNTFFIKNKIENTAYFNERILNQNVYVTDSIYLMKWELLSDTTMILNEKCLSAKTVFRGRSYIAYYSPKFRVDEGPWKFGGLPGLILSIESEDNFIEWNATKIIENYSHKIIPENISSYKFIGWTEFVTLYKQTIERFIKATRSSGKVANEMSAKIKIDAVEIFYPELQTGEGIKF